LPEEPVIAISGDGKPGEPGRKRGWLFGCATAALILVLVAGLGVLGWSWHLNRERERYCAEVRAQIEAYRAARPPVPEAENAAPLYVTAFGLCRSIPPQPRLGTPQNSFNPVSLRADFSSLEHVAYLKSNAPCLAALKKALARPKYDSGTGPDRGPGAVVPNLRGFHNALQLLLMAARSAAQSGKPAEALELLGMALRLARDVNVDELVGGFMIQVAMEEMVAGTLERVLNESAPDAAALGKLAKKLDEHLAERNAATEALRGEKLMIITIAAQMMGGEVEFGPIPRRPGGAGGTGGSGGVVVVGWRLLGCDLRDARTLERHFDAAIAAAEKLYPRALDEFDALKPEELTVPGWAKLPETLLGTYRMALGQDAEILARLELARLAIGCRLYRIRNGSYPAKLSELSAAFPKRFATLPVDPFSGKDFKYQQTKTGCKLWSVGRDRTDDGGGPTTIPGTGELPDIVFELKK